MRLTFLRNYIVNLNEIEFIDDSVMGEIKLHFKSGKEVTIGDKCFDKILGDLNMWDRKDRGVEE